jgi:hypothetical protein
MANGRNKASKGDSGRDAGGFVALPWAVLDCPAYARLSLAARSLLLEIARQFVKDNNGRLLASGAYLLKRGWKSADVITRAKRELLAAGFIFETVMGHRPNKASWYAVTWQRLDKLKGYDPGATELFTRGAYAAGAPLQPQRTREELYEKWRKPAKKNASLTPSGGVERALIAPSGGVEGLTVAPSDGAIDPISTPLSTPSDGNHLEMPSTALEPLSDVSASGMALTPADALRKEVVRVRDSELDPNFYDTITGDFLHPPAKPVRRQKLASDAWVATALKKRPLSTHGA